MTEAEWLACEDPEAMFALLKDGTSARKWRLFAAACCRRVWAQLGSHHWKDVELAEQLADGHGSVLEAARRLQFACIADIWIPETRAPFNVLKLEGWCVSLHEETGVGVMDDVKLTSPVDYRPETADSTARECAYLRIDYAAHGWEGAEAAAEFSAERNAQLPLLRDIFGTPFRPVAFSPSWRTDTAVALAQQMYDSRDFSAMPILADALQDAGCDNEDILSHCRDAKQGHVRGCWVVDLVLGKE